jgi:hypothetical protein
VFDPLVGQVGGWTVGARWLQLQRSVGPPPVVVTGVPVECSAEVPFTDDEHAVGDLAAYGADESLRVGVRLWAAWRDLADGDAGVGQHGVEGGGELAGSVTTP